MYVCLRLINGDKLEFTVKQKTFIIGRSNKCDIVIPQEGMSRQHVQVDVEDNGDVYVTDMGSTNGVYIDGNRLEVGKRTHYLTYLTLAFGAVKEATIDVEGTGTIKPDEYQHLKSSLPTASGTAETKVMKTKSLKMEMEKEKQAQPQTHTHTHIKKTREQLNKGKGEASNLSMILTILMAIAMVGGAAYYYMMKEDPGTEEIEVIEVQE